MNKFTYLFLAGALWACGSSAPEQNNTSESNNDTENTVVEQNNTDVAANSASGGNVSYTFTDTYKGKINNERNIIMNFTKTETSTVGSYQYEGKEETIYLNQKSQNGNEYLFEESVYSDESSVELGSFKGTFINQRTVFSGTWTSKDGSKEFPFSVQATTTPFSFSSNVAMDDSNEGGEVTMIHTILDANNQEVQKISVEQNMMPDSSITVEDMNFDGHLDIRMTSWIAVNGNTNYSCWLYNPSTQKFEESSKLNELRDPVFDQGKKEVRTTWKVGYGQFSHETYLYQDGQYFMIESGETAMNDEGEEVITSTKYKIVDGKSVKI